MHESLGYSRLRRISLLMPTAQDPLITPYLSKLNKKIIPLKRQFSILSNLEEGKQQIVKTTELTQKDYKTVKRSYNSLIKIKDLNKNPEYSLKYKNMHEDPRYRKLLKMRKQMIEKKSIHSQRKIKNQPDLSLSYLITQPYVVSKQKPTKIQPIYQRGFTRSSQSQRKLKVSKEKGFQNNMFF